MTEILDIFEYNDESLGVLTMTALKRAGLDVENLADINVFLYYIVPDIFSPTYCVAEITRERFPKYMRKSFSVNKRLPDPIGKNLDHPAFPFHRLTRVKELREEDLD